MPGVCIDPCTACGPGACLLCVHVASCGGTPTSGATVVVKQGATTIGSGVTDASGNYCCDITATGPGTYNAAVSLTGNTGSNKDVVVTTCPGTTSAGLTVSPTGNGRVTGNVKGCQSNPLPGATVTINGGTYTTDSSGNWAAAVPSGTYPFTVTFPPRFNAGSGTATVTSCTNSNQSTTLTPATGYQCLPTYGACGTTPFPLKTTLQFTDTGTGMSGAVVYGMNTGMHFSYAGFCACAAKASVGYEVFVDPCGLSPDPNACYAAYTVVSGLGCPENSPPSSGYGGPGWTLTSWNPPPAYSAVYTAPACICPGTPGPCTNGPPTFPPAQRGYPTGGTLTFTE
jgi:hypothetical protein